MTRVRRQTLFMLAGAVALSFVPTIGSSGMGTMGKRFVHADRGLFGGTDPQARPLLAGADEVVEREVAGLLTE